MNAAIAACATALPGRAALLRLSGDAARAIAAAAGVPLAADPWRIDERPWALAGGSCPVRTWWMAAPRSFTGCDVVEILLPGAPDLVELALARLRAAGAAAAGPGGFTRQALANGRLTLDQAEAVLAAVTAGDAESAGRAIARLRGALGAEVAGVRDELIALRAAVEAGLDFADEDGVAGHDRAATARACRGLADRLGRWRVAADALDGELAVCLVGPANAGKSALFRALTGAAALVSPVAGTTRDPLEAAWEVGGRRIQLIDTAGWLERGGGVERAALDAGRDRAAGAALVLACSAPDARLPADAPLPAGRSLVIATKCDLGPADPRAVLAVSAATGAGLAQLAGLVAGRLSPISGGEPRQQRLLGEAIAALDRISAGRRGDEELAEELRLAADRLGELIGATTPDEVLDAIFARFCIGK